MARRRQSIVEDIAELSSILPCWLSFLFAVLFYYFFHQHSDLTPGKIAGVGEMGAYATNQLIKTFCYFLQFIIPFAFLLGALVSLVKTKERYGIFLTLKSLMIALAISLAAILIIAFLSSPPPVQTTNSAIIIKNREVVPSVKQNETSVADQVKPATAAKDNVFTGQEISNVQARLLEDRPAKMLFEIQLNTGRTLFAKNATITDEKLTFENDRGLVVSMNMYDVKKVRKLIEK